MAMRFPSCSVLRTHQLDAQGHLASICNPARACCNDNRTRPITPPSHRPQAALSPHFRVVCCTGLSFNRRVSRRHGSSLGVCSEPEQTGENMLECLLVPAVWGSAGRVVVGWAKSDTLIYSSHPLTAWAQPSPPVPRTFAILQFTHFYHNLTP